MQAWSWELFETLASFYIIKMINLATRLSDSYYFVDQFFGGSALTIVLLTILWCSLFLMYTESERFYFVYVLFGIPWNSMLALVIIIGIEKIWSSLSVCLSLQEMQVWYSTNSDFYRLSLKERAREIELQWCIAIHCLCLWTVVYVCVGYMHCPL